MGMFARLELECSCDTNDKQTGSDGTYRPNDE